MIPLIKDFDTRDLLAVAVIGAYILTSFILIDATLAAGLKDLAFIIIGFYFGNKAALDNNNGTILRDNNNGSILSDYNPGCPYIGSISEPMEDQNNGK